MKSLNDEIYELRKAIVFSIGMPLLGIGPTQWNCRLDMFGIVAIFRRAIRKQ